MCVGGLRKNIQYLFIAIDRNNDINIDNKISIFPKSF